MRRKIHDKLEGLIEAGAAPGFQLALGYKNRTLDVFSLGYRDIATKRHVHDNTHFDLSSLTKIVFTVDRLMWALQLKRIENLDTPLKTWFPFLISELKNRSLLELLNHRAGLPAIFEDTQELSGREEKQRFFLRKLDESYRTDGVGQTLYSDVGFMLLGLVLEQVFSVRLRSLEADAAREGLEFGPLTWKFDALRGLWGFRQVASLRSLDAHPKLLRGRVQDPRADWWMGDAGHAGLFGTALGVELWGQELFSSYHGKGLRLSDRVVRNFIDFDRPREAAYLNGFDTPSENSQAGKYFPKTTVGHLGYTGCSFWMDIEGGARVTLLSHRWQSGWNENKLKELRPDFHDWLYREVFSKLNE